MHRLGYSVSSESAAMAVEDLRERVRPYVSKRFPNMADRIIDRNCLELSFAQAAAEKCGFCLGLEMCTELLNTAGFAVGLDLRPDGYVRQYFYRCRFRRKEGESFA